MVGLVNKFAAKIEEKKGTLTEDEVSCHCCDLMNQLRIEVCLSSCHSCMLSCRQYSSNLTCLVLELLTQSQGRELKLGEDINVHFPPLPSITGRVMAQVRPIIKSCLSSWHSF